LGAADFIVTAFLNGLSACVTAQFHPAAELFPPLGADDLAELAADVTAIHTAMREGERRSNGWAQIARGLGCIFQMSSQCHSVGR
jgi:hypothetical protein